MQNLNLLFYKTYYKEIGKPEFNDDLKTNKNPALTTEAKFEKSDYIPCPIPDAQTFLMETTYPGMLIGTGYAHGSGKADSDINCGFSFDYVTGQPYLPGSSVKGILHSVFFRHPEVVTEYLAKPLENTVDKVKLSREQCQLLEKSIFGSIYTLNDAGTKAEGTIFRDDGIDVFLDAVVKPRDEQDHLLGLDNITPHPSPTKNPIPVLILKILPKVVFEFRFVLKDSVIEIKDSENVPQTFTVTAEQKLVLFRRLLELMGAGAKTNVGYGALKDPENDTESQQEESAHHAGTPVPQVTARRSGLEVGQIVTAKIRKITSDLLTVTVNGKDAYIKKAEVHGNPFEKLDRCKDLKVNAEVRVKVIEISNGSIYLSMKQANQ